MYKAKISKIGNSLGVLLPKELLASMNFEQGAELYLTPHGAGFMAIPHNPAFEADMAKAAPLLAKYRNALHSLKD